MIEQALDAVGKLGPLAVAIAVYLANRRQTVWTNQTGRRAAEVEDQKLRLALLERRAVAIEAVREAAQDFATNGGVTTDTVNRIYEALKIAELVYDDDREAEILACMKKLHMWSFYDRQRLRYRDRDDGKLQEVVDKQMDAEEEISAALQALLEHLRDATKVRMVPQLVAPERRPLQLPWRR